MPKLARIILPLAMAGLLAGAGTGCTVKAQKARAIKRADRYFAAGKYDLAEADYLDAMRLDLADPHPALQLGIIYLSEGRLPHARYFLTMARQQAPNNALARAKLAAIYLAARDYKDAKDEASFALDRNPLDPEAPLILAESVTNAADFQTVFQRLQNERPPAGHRAPILTAIGVMVMGLRSPDLATAEADFKQALADDPKFSAAYAGLANLYVARKDNKLAEEVFKKAVEVADPRSPRSEQFAQFKIRNGDLAGGREILEAQVKKAPDYLPAWLALANLEVVQKQPGEAIASLDHILSRDAANYEGLMLDGRLRLARNEIPKAVSDFEKLTSLYPSPQANYQLAEAYLAQKDVGKAVASLNRCLSLKADMPEAQLLLAQIRVRNGDTSSAIMSLKQLTAKQPYLVPPQLLLARLYVDQGNYSDALDVYGRLVELYPTNAEPYYLAGVLYTDEKKTDVARKAYLRAVEVDPSYLPPLEQLTDMDLTNHQYTAALHRIEQTASSGKPGPGPQLLVAKVFEAQHDAAHAKTALLGAIDRWPDYMPAYLMLAQLYANTGENEMALANLREALIKSPTNETALMLTAVIHHQEKDYAAARDAYEKVLAVNPNYTPALNNLAYLDSEQFNLVGKAYELASRARELLPEDPYTADTYGWVLYHRGDYAWALGPLQQSADQITSEPEVQYHLGITHYMMGEEAPARAALERAMKLGMPFDGKEEAAERLHVLAIDPKTAGPEVRADLEKRAAEHPDPVVLARLGAIYEHNGADDKAVSAYESALKLNTNNVSALVELSRLYSGPVKNLPRALSLAHAADRLAPDNPAADHALGRASYLSGDYRYSVNLLEQADSLRPGNPEWVLDLAEASYAQGRVPEAQNELRTVLRSGANTNFARAGEAGSLLDLITLSSDPAQAAAAVPQLEQTLKTNADYVPALMAMAVAQEQQTNLAAAVAEYRKALDRYPDFSPAARRLAIIYSATPDNMPKTAYELAGKARDAYPDDPAIAKALGIAVFYRKDYFRSERLLKESAAQSAADAYMMYYLGMDQYHTKETADAKKSLQQAIDLKLPEKLDAEVRETLKQLK